MAIKFLWVYDLPVTVNQIAVGTVVLVCTSFWIACGAVCYNKHVYSNLIATCRNHSLKDHSHGVYTMCNNLLFLNPKNGLVHSMLREY